MSRILEIHELSRNYPLQSKEKIIPALVVGNI